MGRARGTAPWAPHPVPILGERRALPAGLALEGRGGFVVTAADLPAGGAPLRLPLGRPGADPARAVAVAWDGPTAAVTGPPVTQAVTRPVTCPVAPRDPEAGFTLIEALVAMAILAVGAVSLLTAIESHARRIGDVTERTAARWAAEARLTERRLGLPAGEGPGEGLVESLGRDWAVTDRRDPTEPPALPRALLAAVAVAAVLRLGAAAAPVAWQWAGWSAAEPARTAAGPPAAPPPAPPDLDPILALAPFGAVPAPDPAPEGPAAEITLDLVLQGVLLQADLAASMALIARDGVTAGVRTGDAVAEGATLEEVAATQVVLRVGGDLQTLSFPEGERGEEAAAPDPATLSGPDRLRRMIAAQAAGGGDEPAAEAAPLSVEDRIDLWRDRIRANPAEVLDSIGLIPTPEGHGIAEDHDSGVGLAGLRAGDVVRSVNGQAVGDVERDRQTFGDVAASGVARVEVVRGDRVLTLTFPLR